MTRRGEEARSYAERGWRVYPIWHAEDGACGCGNPRCHSPAKHPHDGAIRAGGGDGKGTDAATDDLETVGRWFDAYPAANVGIRTGAVSGVLVLDIDSDEGQATVEAWEASPTPTVLTGKGQHLYFRYPSELGLERITSHVKLVPGLDIRADGSGVVAPPSTHVSGRSYEWAPGLSPDEVELADCPPPLLDLIMDKIRSGKDADRPKEQTPADADDETATSGDISGRILKLVTSDADFAKAWSGTAGFPSLSEHRLSTAKRLVEHGWTDDDILAGLREFDTQHGRDPQPKATYLKEIGKARRLVRETEAGETKGGRQPAKLIRILERDEATYVKDELQNPFLQMPMADGQTLTVPLWSRDLATVLNGRYYDETGDTLGKGQLTEALAAIEHRCLDGGIIHPITRMGRIDDAIYVDHLCNGDRCLVLRGGEVAEGHLPAGHYFQRPAHMQPYGRIDFAGDGRSMPELMRLMNLADRDDFRLLLAVWITSVFVPGIPHPILLLVGPHGTAKSTTFRMIRELTDPSSVKHLAPPRDVRDLVVHMNENHVVLYDNVSRIGSMGDDYCRAITGEHMMVRDLYTTADSRIFSYQRVLGFNGIDVPLGQSDLLDRVLIVETEYIPADRRLREDSVWSRFSALKPLVIGEMLMTVSQALDMPLRTRDLPRMADWAAWGANIADLMDTDPDAFLAAYGERIAEAREVGLDSNLFVHLVKELVLQHADPQWKIRPTELLTQVTNIAEERHLNYRRDDSWPYQPEWVTRRLNLASEDLRHAGITFRSGVSDGPNQRALLFSVER